MDDNAVDQIIADKKEEIKAVEKPAAKPAPAATPAAEPAKTPDTTEIPDAAPADEAAPADGEGDGLPDNKTPWPKTAVNAVRRRDNKLNQFRGQLAERDQKLSDPAFLKGRLVELEGGNKPAGVAPQADPADPEPDVTKYNDWDKYQADLRAWDKRQVVKELKGTMTETQKAGQQDALIAERAEIAATKAKEVIEKNPEFLEVVQQNADIIDAFPSHAQHALLQADNATLAVVVLANEGTLEDLSEMSPALAERTIKAAQTRGLALIAKDEGSETADAPAAPAGEPAKKVSQAPAPMKAAKAVTQSGTKRAKDMNDSEFRKEFFA